MQATVFVFHSHYCTAILTSSISQAYRKRDSDIHFLLIIKNEYLVHRSLTCKTFPYFLCMKSTLDTQIIFSLFAIPEISVATIKCAYFPLRIYYLFCHHKADNFNQKLVQLNLCIALGFSFISLTNRCHFLLFYTEHT